jgi:hypothetical protein
LITDGSQVYEFGNIGALAAMETGTARIDLPPERARHTREFIYDERLSLL